MQQPGHEPVDRFVTIDGTGARRPAQLLDHPPGLALHDSLNLLWLGRKALQRHREDGIDHLPPHLIDDALDEVGNERLLGNLVSERLCGACKARLAGSDDSAASVVEVVEFSDGDPDKGTHDDRSDGAEIAHDHCRVISRDPCGVGRRPSERLKVT
jgi:hypothetical protein